MTSWMSLFDLQFISYTLSISFLVVGVYFPATPAELGNTGAGYSSHSYSVLHVIELRHQQYGATSPAESDKA